MRGDPSARTPRESVTPKPPFYIGGYKMIFSKEWWKAAIIRAVKTFAQALIAAIGSEAIFAAVNWSETLSIAGLAAVLSLLTSLAGLPEVPKEEETKNEISG